MPDFDFSIIAAPPRMRARLSKNADQEEGMASLDGQVIAIGVLCNRSGLSSVTESIATINPDWLVDALGDKGDEHIAYLVQLDGESFPSWWYQHEFEWVRLDA